ncbi:MAG: hypothetical protein NZ853_00990 [Leptospiraceae bacterium]|nr:hypothetical protein [Leptospiraceae bacterium]MDW7976196.1 hypothetical protein [Leptospiraceae bacterium]
MKPKKRWLTLTILVVVGLSLGYCGGKKSGLLLLPNLASGEGGPLVSPENPKTAANETTTTQQTPSIEVGNNYGVIDTANLPKKDEKNQGESKSETTANNENQDAPRNSDKNDDKNKIDVSKNTSEGATTSQENTSGSTSEEESASNSEDSKSDESRDEENVVGIIEIPEIPPMPQPPGEGKDEVELPGVPRDGENSEDKEGSGDTIIELPKQPVDQIDQPVVLPVPEYPIKPCNSYVCPPGKYCLHVMPPEDDACLGDVAEDPIEKIVKEKAEVDVRLTIVNPYEPVPADIYEHKVESNKLVSQSAEKSEVVELPDPKYSREGTETTSKEEKISKQEVLPQEEKMTEEEIQEEEMATKMEEEMEEEDLADEEYIPDVVVEEVNKSCKANIVKIDTTKGTWFNSDLELLPHPKNPKKTIKAKGIHTYWAYQNLLITINSTCNTKQFRLVVVARNIHGPLPNWYHFFNVKVVNNNTGETLGTMLIRAHDKKYHRGSLNIELKKGKNEINLIWTNDAWQPDEFDANIQIKRILILNQPKKEPKQILSRKGSNFCDVNGRWFVGIDPPSAYTYWQDQTVSYCLKTPKSGKYEIYVKAGNAKEGWPLMPEYKEYQVLVAANGMSNYITIPAAQGKYLVGKTMLNLPEGHVKLDITWLNDMWQPDRGYDANIEITHVRIKHIGDADSAIAAYLLQNPNITYKVVIPGIILIGGILGLIYWYRREKLA